MPFSIGLLLLISITRYCRPKTECSFFEKLTLPEIVFTLWNFCITAASFEPTSDPCALLIAVTRPSMVAGPVMKPPVPAWICFASLFTVLFGSWPNAFAYVTNQ